MLLSARRSVNYNDSINLFSLFADDEFAARGFRNYILSVLTDTGLPKGKSLSKNYLS